MFSFLVEKSNFCFLTDDNQTVVVSTVEEEVAEIFIHAGTLKIIPQASEGYFQVFMDVLEFVSSKHIKEMEDVVTITWSEKNKKILHILRGAIFFGPLFFKTDNLLKIISLSLIRS